MIYKILTIIFLITSIGSLILTLLLFNSKSFVTVESEVEVPLYFSTKNNLEIEYEMISKVEKSPVQVDSLHITGWIPEWDISDGLQTISNNPNVFDSISPIWFFINEDGTLKKTPQTNGPNQINFFRERGIELIPSIQEFDAENFNKFINKPGNSDKLINEIVKESVENNYHGIDLDIEATKLEDKKLLIEFLRNLKSELEKVSKKLVFTALPKWSDYNLFASFPQTMRVQDYAEIASIVDELRLMTYEFSGPRSSKIGPVQPLEWQEQVIKYSISQGVPREKLVLGIATYSYDWSEREFLQKIDLISRPPASQIDQIELELGASLNNSDVEKIKSRYAFTEEFNQIWGEAILRYKFNNQNRIVVFPNDESIRVRKELAAEYGIKGVAFWRLGDNGSLKL